MSDSDPPPDPPPPPPAHRAEPESAADSQSDSSGDSREGNDVGDLYRAFDERQSTARKIRKAFGWSAVVIIVLIVLSPCAFVAFVLLSCMRVIP